MRTATQKSAFGKLLVVITIIGILIALLLAGRNATSLAHFLPRMERACEFIERTRDPKNNPFLVGPACNLLAPSYGGVRQPDGTFGKGYLAGLSITYLAALDRMVDLRRNRISIRRQPKNNCYNVENRLWIPVV